MKKVLVLYGGKSVEHDISIITALQAMNAIKNDVLLLPVYVTGDGQFVSASNLLDVNIYSDFARKAKHKKEVYFQLGKGTVVLKGRFKNKAIKPDVALICNHGANGEDGMMSALMELAGIAYTCPSVECSSVCMDKEVTKIILASKDIPVTDFVCGEDLKIKDITSALTFPIIVKPSRCGSSVGITKCDNAQQLKISIDTAKMYDKKLLFEHFIENGREFNCACLCRDGKYKTSKVCEVRPKGLYSFEEKYLSDKPSSTFKIEKEAKKMIEKLTVEVCKILDCQGVVRVDFLMAKDGKMFVNEVNTIPGSLAVYLFDNMKEVVFESIDMALERFEKNKQISFNNDSQALNVFANANMNKYAKK